MSAERTHNENQFSEFADSLGCEHYIPIRQADLVSRLADLTPPEHRTKLLELTQLLSATFHHEFHQRLVNLKDAYSSLDPDRDTIVVESKSDNQSTELVTPSNAFFAETVELLERANFIRLERSHIEQAIEVASEWGVNLEVDFELFERLEIFARGEFVGIQTKRRPFNLFREDQIDVPTYQRLVVAFQLRPGHKLERGADPDKVYLKLFKNIPKMDLEMLLPGTRVKITRLDQGKIILPTLSGIVMALFKIIKGVALLATASFAGLLSFLGILGGTIGYGVKSFLGYLRTKDKYHRR